jgi:glucokinase
MIDLSEATPSDPGEGAGCWDYALVGDIGGTNARFALAPLDPRGGLSWVRSLKTADYAGLNDAVGAYLAHFNVSIARCVLAVAGAPQGRTLRLTNCSWVIDMDGPPGAIASAQYRIVNDFAANAQAVADLRADDVEMIGEAERRWDAPGVSAILGPGTGLGMGALSRQGRETIVLPSEGGHVGFAPSSPLEQELLTVLSRRFGRVSWERLLCGPGLVNLYEALGEIEGRPVEAATAEQITASQDGPARRAVTLFCELLGSYAGDAVLMLGAWNGAFLTGGVLDAMRPVLRSGGFRRRFEDKGRFGQHLRATPVMMVDRPNLGLAGAAAFARAPW